MEKEKEEEKPIESHLEGDVQDSSQSAQETELASKDSDQVSISKSEYEALTSKLKEYEALQDRMVRSAADFENAKKRLAKEREEFAQFALESFFHDTLPVLDNYERALSHKSEEQTAAEKSIWSGIELIHKQLNEILKSRGLVRMEVLKKPFDPNVHEAVTKVESDKEVEGTVAEEVLAGYLLRGKVLRPAKVKVFTRPPEPESEKLDEIT